MSQSLKILLALTDSQLAHQMSQKLKKHFAKVELEISVCEDGRRALSEFAQLRPDIVVATYSLPNLDGYILAEEITKMVGGVGIFILSQKGENPSTGERIDLPIVNWSDLLNRVQNSMPDYLKTQFGISIHDSVLYSNLLEYAKKYVPNEEAGEKVLKKGVSLIPVLFSEQSSLKTEALKSKLVLKELPILSSDKIIQFRELDKRQGRKAIIIDAAILTLLFSASAFFQWKGEDTGALFSIRNLVVAVTAFAFLGFFLGRVFDRFIFSKES